MHTNFHLLSPFRIIIVYTDATCLSFWYDACLSPNSHKVEQFYIAAGLEPAVEVSHIPEASFTRAHQACSPGPLFIMPNSLTPSPSPSTSRSSSISSTSLPRTPPNLHQNTIEPEAKWLVQKFGGTSVGKFATKIAEDIVACVAKLCRSII